MTNPYQLGPGPRSKRASSPIRHLNSRSRTATSTSQPAGPGAPASAFRLAPILDTDTVTRRYQCVTCQTISVFTRPATQPGRKPGPMPVTQAITAGWIPRQTGWVCPACTSKGAPS
jgi:hypothetical protein